MESFKRDIFEQLGNLFYAIAKDQHISPLEFGRLKMVLRADWLTDPKHRDKDAVTEASHLIIITMDHLQTIGTAADDAFNAFTRFYIQHREQFTEALKDKIVSIALAITDVFPSGSRLKNNHIIKVKLLFQNSSLVV